MGGERGGRGGRGEGGRYQSLTWRELGREGLRCWEQAFAWCGGGGEEELGCLGMCNVEGKEGGEG